MPVDEDLAKRVRALLADEAGVTEQRTFGGLAFLVGGNMAVAVSGQGGLMVRVHRHPAGQAARTAVRDEPPRAAGLAAGRPRRARDQAAARVVGHAGGGVRALAASEERVALTLP